MNSKRVALLVLAAIVIAIISLGAGFGIGSAVFKSTDAPTTPATTTAAPPWLLPYDGAASSIFSYLTSANGAGVGVAYEWLANLTDSFGNRKVCFPCDCNTYKVYHNSVSPPSGDSEQSKGLPVFYSKENKKLD